MANAAVRRRATRGPVPDGGRGGDRPRSAHRRGSVVAQFVGVIAPTWIRAESGVVVDIDLPATDYPDPRNAAAGSLLIACGNSWVAAAAMADALPLHRVSLTSFTIAGQPPRPPEPHGRLRNVTPTTEHSRREGRGRGITGRRCAPEQRSSGSCESSAADAPVVADPLDNGSSLTTARSRSSASSRTPRSARGRTSARSSSGPA